VTVMLNEGDKAPDFSLPRDGGDTVSLADYKGKKVVVYFYPKDSTPGCTTEANDFTRLKPEFDALGVEIAGVSRDSLKRHENFITKQEIKIALLSDEDGAMTDAFGVWVEKKNYGRTYMGIERSTFLINEEGVIEKIWRKVRVKGHVDAVLEAAKGN
jgi:thioredoxin-dependent peroxiredoxin